MPRDSNRARLEHAHTLLVGAVEQLVASDGWRTMLEVAARFHRYSARNCLLLLAQQAQGMCAGYRTWQQIPAEGGGTCQVRKGAKALTILAPTRRPVERTDTETGEQTRDWILTGFRPVSVFDERALLRRPAIAQVTPTLLEGHAPEAVRAALVATLEAEGFPVVSYDTTPANGMTVWEPPAVLVRPDLSEAQQLKTLLHEAGHVLLHHPERPGGRLAREVKEIEAESVAFLAGRHVGIDTSQYSIPYVAHWSGGDPTAVLQQADRVVAAGRQLTAAIDAGLGVQPSTQLEDARPSGCVPPHLTDRLAALRAAGTGPSPLTVA